MGYRFGDFIGDVVSPITDVFTSPLKNIMGSFSNIASSLSLPLLVGGAAVLLIVIKK
jgi:hypothetical protein